jgi:hypothetical protein
MTAGLCAKCLLWRQHSVLVPSYLVTFLRAEGLKHAHIEPPILHRGRDLKIKIEISSLEGGPYRPSLPVVCVLVQSGVDKPVTGIQC